MIIAVVILFVAVVVLGVLFYFLEKRQQILSQQIAKIQEDDVLTRENCKTLRQNDEILAKDMKMVLHEIKDVEKKVKRNA